MNETARILRTASADSLVILDEIGRGTSTEDGRAIAWAVCEHLLDAVQAQTLFATHLRELTQLTHRHAANWTMEVVEEEQEVVFLKRVAPGAADQSYGVHVAALAGVPDAVVQRAHALLRELGDTPLPEPRPPSAAAPAPDAQVPQPSEVLPPGPEVPGQSDLFTPHELVGRAVAAVDVESTTPLAALELLVRWQRELRRSADS